TYLETLLGTALAPTHSPDAGPATIWPTLDAYSTRAPWLAASVKERVLQFLAVRASPAEPPSAAPVPGGPPACGKTSVAGSSARAAPCPAACWRLFERPGSAIPVLLADELDKLGRRGMHGDPSATLLEATVSSPAPLLLREAELLRVIDAYTREAGVASWSVGWPACAATPPCWQRKAPPSEPLRVDADVLRQIFEEADGADCRPTPSPYEQMTMSAANSGAPLEPGVCRLLLECGWTLEPAVDARRADDGLGASLHRQVGEVMRESVTLCISWLSSRLNSQLRRNRCRLHVHSRLALCQKTAPRRFAVGRGADLPGQRRPSPGRGRPDWRGDSPGARVLAIGGVPAKLEAAARAGLHSVVLPMAQSD
uniref:ATPase_AAA_core domain-containing protein n=1 Tax=Macrostomum lignano TaxID=282301 RepID=A0A1I8F800_9PLAT